MDLNAPLGFDPPPPRRRFLPVAALAIGALLFVAVGALVYEADPHGGEPYAVAVIPPATTTRPAIPGPREAVDPAPTASIAKAAPGAEEDATRIENGVRVVSPLVAGKQAAARDPGPQIIDVSKALDESARKTVVADHPPGNAPLPRVVTDAGPHGHPRIAILVGGLGLNEIATRTAIELLPAPVSLAFVPYGAGLASSVATARQKGHEILLQIPMQSANGASPGPHALSSGESESARGADLDWMLSQFGGYVGFTNLLGANVTASEPAMRTVIGAVAKRGLFYVDDGTSRKSVAVAVGRNLGIAAAKADVVLDATNDPAVVRANLDRLVSIAQAHGSAIGSANALSDYLQAIAQFAQEARGRGIDLVPVSAIAREPARMTTSR